MEPQKVKRPSDIKDSPCIIAIPPKAITPYTGVYWPDWDPKKVIVNKPEVKTSQDNPDVKYRELVVQYNHGTVKKEIRGPVEFEFPYTIVDGELRDLVESFNGVRQKPTPAKVAEAYKKAKKAYDKKKKEGKNVKEVPEPRAKHSLVIPLNTQNDIHVRFLEIMREFYIELLRALHHYLGDQFSMPAWPESEISELKESICLKYPVSYRREDEGKGKVIPGSAPSINMSVTKGGPHATKFVSMKAITKDEKTGEISYTVKYHTWEEVFNRGMLHIPRVCFPNMFIGETKMVRVQCTSTFISKFTSTATAGLGSMADNIAKAGIVTQEDVETGNFVKDVIAEEKKALDTKEVTLPGKTDAPLVEADSGSTGSSGSSSSTAEEVVPPPKPKIQLKPNTRQPAASAKKAEVKKPNNKKKDMSSSASNDS